MVIKTYIPTNLCDSSDGSDVSDSIDVNDICDSSDGSDSCDSNGSQQKISQFFFILTKNVISQKKCTKKTKKM